MAEDAIVHESPLHLHQVAGFRVGVASCGLKKSGKPDVGVLLCENEDCSGAAVFTRNLVSAAPVKLCRPRARAGRFRAVLVNSGNANCCTGQKGFEDAETGSALAAKLLGVDNERVLVCSTGVIGRHLDMTKLASGTEAACADALEAGRGDLAAAILTTDLTEKRASAETTIGGRKVVVAGVAKGSGMIAPNMGTMLAYFATDAAVAPDLLREMTGEIADASFNRVIVDGDTSTNDTFAIMASGAAGNEPLASMGSTGAASLMAAMTDVAVKLARMIADDGEGAAHLVTVDVLGALDNREAELIARTVAGSPLVKTAIAGRDPNWGRILAAAGRSGASFDENSCVVRLAGATVFDRGAPPEGLPGDMAERMARREVTIEVDLGLGKGRFRVWTCDFTEEYIRINAHYHT